MRVLDRLTNRQVSRQQSIAEQYKLLLHRLACSSDEPTDKDVEQLDNLSSQLGYDRQAVADHLEVVRRAKELEPLVADEAQRKNDHDQKMKARREHEDSMLKEIERLRLENLALKDKRAKAETLYLQSLDAIKEINALKEKYPHLI